MDVRVRKIEDLQPEILEVVLSLTRPDREGLAFSIITALAIHGGLRHHIPRHSKSEWNIDESKNQSAPAWSRRIELSFRINTEKANAKFTNGILRIELPKAEAAGVKKITIQ